MSTTWSMAVQPSGEVRSSAEQAGSAAADLGEAAMDFFQAWAEGEYGWVLGAIVLFLLLRFVWRSVKG